MWFKVFVLFRPSVSVIYPLGYSFALTILNEPGMDFLGSAFVLGV